MVVQAQMRLKRASGERALRKRAGPGPAAHDCHFFAGRSKELITMRMIERFRACRPVGYGSSAGCEPGGE